jgi:putative NADPH-quinone reductase
MTPMRVLTINGFDTDEPAMMVDRITETLTDNGHDVGRLDLATAGFDAFMTADERAAYHTDNPLITAEAAAAAELVRAAAGIVIAYPIVHGTAPARVKSFHERVFVLGVGFEFLPSGRITGALHHVKRACVIGVDASPGGPRASSTWGRRNDFGPCLARSFYLSSNRGCKARYLGLVDDGAVSSAKVERQLSGW